jgi:hypothetical protein
MSPRVRSLATLAVLGLVLLLAGVWGWSAISEPFPKESTPPVCVDREYARGDVVKPRAVTVSVWNGGTRVGLAGLTMDLLSEAGFHEGSEGNTPGKRRVQQVEIWTPEPGSPAVRLVASRFRQVDVVKRDTPAPGVLVVVGDGFDDLVPGKKSVTAGAAASVCGPPRRAS